MVDILNSLPDFCEDCPYMNLVFKESTAVGLAEYTCKRLDICKRVFNKGRSESKSCSTCKHREQDINREPCASCWRSWKKPNREPAEATEHMKNEDVNKTCSTCKHVEDAYEKCCSVCYDYHYWEPTLEEATEHMKNEDVTGKEVKVFLDGQWVKERR